MFRMILPLVGWLTFLPVAGMATPGDLEPWPPADNGYQRMVIRLPALDNEMDHRVELVIGKQLQVDCNLQHFGGRLERHTVTGWGYDYLRLTDVRGPVSTMMSCPPGQPTTQRLVVVRGPDADHLQRYNSKLPLVVYVPAGFEVHYRIWSAGDMLENAEPE